MKNSDLDRVFGVLDGCKNLGPEFFGLKIRLAHQELQEVKAESEARERALRETPTVRPGAR